MNRSRRVAGVVSLLILSVITTVFAHGGGLDANGGHNDRKAGTYHFHRGPLMGRTFGSKTEAMAALSASSKSSNHGTALASGASPAEVGTLVSLLIKKGIITAEELEREINALP